MGQGNSCGNGPKSRSVEDSLVELMGFTNDLEEEGENRYFLALFTEKAWKQ